MDLRLSFFNNFNKILPSNTRHILVAVSGGVDSMVLLDLFQNSIFSLSVAHANFKLRSIESDADEDFVKNKCLQKKIPFYGKRFDIITHARMNKCSVQMSARTLRYNWFYHLGKNLHCDCIVLGHNLNDEIETFFMNLSRGTGLKGLLGIPKKVGPILRPLLPFTRKQIMLYARSRNLHWREDSSNKEYKYLRNVIRHRVVPVLFKILPNFEQNFYKTLYHLNQYYSLSEQAVHISRIQITVMKKIDPFLWEINTEVLKRFYPLNGYLFRLFSPYGFKNLPDLKRLLQAQPGKQLFSKYYRLVSGQNRWLLMQKKI
ncbi:MAG: tRNA lysidine(34) synthetase TilS [Candidatus Walczuchella monophlebidarum]